MTDTVVVTDTDAMKERLVQAGYDPTTVVVVTDPRRGLARTVAAEALRKRMVSIDTGAQVRAARRFAILAPALLGLPVDTSINEKYECITCGDCIPPGRSGRMCRKCRSKQ